MTSKRQKDAINIENVLEENAENILLSIKKEQKDAINIQSFAFDLRHLSANHTKKFAETLNAGIIKITNLKGLLSGDLTFWILPKEKEQLINLVVDKTENEIFILVPFAGEIALKPFKKFEANICFDFEILCF